MDIWSSRPPFRSLFRLLRALQMLGVLGVSLLLAGSLLGTTVAVSSAALASPLVDHSSGGELVQVGRDESILLSVNAETTADMVGVDILIPPGFSPDLHTAPDAKGGGVGGVFITWQAHFSGPQL